MKITSVTGLTLKRFNKSKKRTFRYGFYNGTKAGRCTCSGINEVKDSVVPLPSIFTLHFHTQEHM